MPRRPRRLSDVQARFSGEPRSGRRRRRRAHEPRNGFEYLEIVAAVCKYFCKGHTATEIAERMRDEHGVEMTREEPYQFIAYAAAQNWLRFAAPHDYRMQETMKQRYPWLQTAEVVQTAVFDDVARHAARALLELVKLRCRPPYPAGKKDVHIGFAGGHAMRKLAQCFAELLRQPTDGLPQTLWFHAMAAGMSVYEPATDPNAFFTYFFKDPALQVDTRFVGLHAPPLVKTRQLRSLRSMHGIRESYREARHLDIIVTSAGSWRDKHNMLKEYMNQSKNDLPTLEKAGCVGDFLWRPVGDAGPIDLATEIRAMTLMDLDDLPRFVQRGGHVMLTLGPCGGCGRPKTDILNTLLSMQTHLVTHLVVDSRTLRGIIDGAQAA